MEVRFGLRLVGSMAVNQGERGRSVSAGGNSRCEVLHWDKLTAVGNLQVGRRLEQRQGAACEWRLVRSECRGPHRVFRISVFNPVVSMRGLL